MTSSLPSSVNRADEYPIRTAEIGFLSVTDVSLAATVQLGDRGLYTPKLFALAVQRQEDHAKSGSVYFESYSIFERSFPVFSETEEEADETACPVIVRHNHCPRISVGCVSVIALGADSSLLAGNMMEMNAESRIKHIRQYKRPSGLPAIGC
ncbi:spore germination protein GerPE [Paenibacillus sp. NPDC058071]|uniref:spore germination protein GerPE n=1 Tax=Paenibacillus sp. NPDC058071 TaxID=3346326 RepID=UPI0036DE5C8C